MYDKVRRYEALREDQLANVTVAVVLFIQGVASALATEVFWLLFGLISISASFYFFRVSWVIRQEIKTLVETDSEVESAATPWKFSVKVDLQGILLVASLGFLVWWMLDR